MRHGSVSKKIHKDNAMVMIEKLPRRPLNKIVYDKQDLKDLLYIYLDQKETLPVKEFY